MTKDVRVALMAWNISSDRRMSYRPNVRHGMPFTVGYLMRWSKALRHPMGEHRAAAAIHELQRLKKLIPQGFYKSKKHGYRVTLYALGARSSSVRRSEEVKAQKRRLGERGWWLHSLFGTFDGLPPPDASPDALARWRSEGHRKCEMARARA